MGRLQVHPEGKQYNGKADTDMRLAAHGRTSFESCPIPSPTTFCDGSPHSNAKITLDTRCSNQRLCVAIATCAEPAVLGRRGDICRHQRARFDCFPRFLTEMLKCVLRANTTSGPGNAHLLGNRLVYKWAT